jgi:hypothetical protein
MTAGRALLSIATTGHVLDGYRRCREDVGMLAGSDTR